MKAVVANISFGLGNQLLQFATGYALSKRLGCPLDLDVSWFSRDPVNTAQRDLLITRLIPTNCYRQMLNFSKPDLFRDRACRIANRSWSRSYRHSVPVWSDQLEFCEPFTEIRRPVCIIGVPGDLQNFSNVRTALREILIEGLSSAADISPPVGDYAFVHVRLGDYVTDAQVAAQMRSLDLSYFSSGIDAYEAKHGRTKWMLCSDNPRAALNLIPKGINIEVSKGRSEFDDMLLMARSNGGVISNSTFSLWGGLLSEANAGSIVAPRVWRKDALSLPPLPSDWILI